jgi:DNA-binding SARP family transcriptional activator/predicted ATPase
MAQLYLRLLGAFEATVDGQPITRFDSAKVRALLAYLVAESDRPHRREILAALLWPDQPASNARRNLRNALSNLRGAIGDRGRGSESDRDRVPPILLVTRESVQFNCDSDCWVDVRAFQTLVEHQRLGPPDTDRLAEAVSLYRGTFLEGFFVKGSAAFDDWALLVRDRFHRQASSAFQSLITHYSERGDHVQACAYAWRRVALEPWREDAYRQLMRNLALSGERTTALAQYDVCREVLAEEFGVEPSPEMQRLYEQIRDGTLVAGVPTVPVPMPDPTVPRSMPEVDEFELPLFVGRDREMAELDAHLDQALAGHGRVVFVTGEAGEGKTALIQAFAHRALQKHPSLIPACGNCNAYTGVGDPYLPFREILEMLAGDIEARAAAVAVGGDVVARLVNAFPTVAQTLLREGKDLIDLFVPGSHLLQRADSYAREENVWSGSVQVTRAWITALRAQVARKAEEPVAGMQQEDLFRQVTAVLKTLARSAPLLLVLDDLQWADAGSLSLLFHLGRRLEGRPILIVGAYRSEEVALGRDGERHPLESAINEFARMWGDIKVDVGQADGAAFVEALLENQPNMLTPSFRETLTLQTQGHPLFTVELLLGMQERGDLIRDGNGCWVEGQTLDWEILPGRVEAVIEERVDRLDGPLKAALRTASVEGEVFTAEILARVQSTDTREMVMTLSGQLDRRHHLVRAQGMQQAGDRRLSRYRFRHILFQRYLYNSLDAVERSHLHNEVGTALRASCAGGVEVLASVIPQLAWHAEQAGMISEAVDYYQQAGDRALHMSANEEARSHLQRAIELLGRLPHTLERDRRELVLQFAVAVPIIALRSWGAPEALDAYERALALSEACGDDDQRMQALAFVRAWYTVRSNHSQALAHANEYHGRALQSGDPLLLMLGHYEMCIALLFVGDLTESLAHAEHMLSLYDPQEHQFLTYRMGQDPAVVAYLTEIYALWYLGYPDRALRRAAAGVAYATEMNHPFNIQFIVGFKTRLHRWRREVARVQELVETMMSIWEEHHIELAYAQGMLENLWVLSRLGDPEAAAKLYKQALTTWLTTGMANHLPEFWSVLAQMYAKAGQVEKALSLMEDALARIAETEERYHEAEVYRLRGEFRLQQNSAPGTAAGAEADFRRAIEISRRQAARMLELRATVSLCRLWLAQGRMGRLSEAREMLGAIYGWFTEGFETQDLREARAVLDRLSAGL